MEKQGRAVTARELTVRVSPTLSALIKVEWRIGVAASVDIETREAFRRINDQLSRDTAADIPIDDFVRIAPLLEVN
jgi:hypothetical protein